MQIFNHQYKLATSRVKIRNEKKNKEITLSRVMNKFHNRQPKFLNFHKLLVKKNKEFFYLKMRLEQFFY
jgi:hypothetical protein